MVTLLSEVLASFAFARSFPKAVEAIATNAKNQRAARLRMFAVGCLFVSSLFLVSAAVMWSPMRGSLLIDVLGWTGIVFLEAFLIVGNRCFMENQAAGAG